MKKQSLKTIIIGLVTALIIIISAILKAGTPKNIENYPSNTPPAEEIANLLETKCNSCHRKKNPFMVFNKKNMNKRAKIIYDQVFVKKRMPKGSKLSDSESALLKNWLESNI